MVRARQVLLALLVGGGCATDPRPTIQQEAPIRPEPQERPQGEQPEVSIVSPKADQTVTSTDIPVQLSIERFKLSALEMGQPAKPGQGHLHVMVDGTEMAQMTDFFFSDRFTIPGDGLAPGKHTIHVQLAADDHRPIGKPVSVTIDYQPTRTKALPEPLTLGQPSIRITSPKEGATVPRRFDLVLEVSNFRTSCALEGRPNIKGYGHFHTHISQEGVTDQPSVLGKDPDEHVTLTGMPCVTRIPVDMTKWKSGPATISVVAAENDHSEMPISAKVNVKVE